ncbi:E3 ubiquitin-protein ligase TRIM31 [Arvicanthis niloticus]|uniref:E3 ubiquitin-protein ligase TRIM31 n=1 Tax=Arvicanthis niloticus TaxID=61156 RepID=UPI00148663CF|nr:E3 ubiquitin-protein ligase TRIM31 [Arvicanthis niloticus]
MAGQQLASQLQEDVTCPICMEILQEPVTIDCGHNFCLQCISQVGETSKNIQCPLCKLSVSKDTFRPNKLLASLAEKIQTMDPADIQPEMEYSRCQRHKEKLHYFCEQDGEFLCVVCRDSKDHKSHNVTLIDEAAQNYKVQIESQAQDLEQKDKEIIEEKKRDEGAIWAFRAQVDLEKITIIEKFRLLRQRLDEEESFLLSRLDWLEHQGAKQLGQYVTVTEKQLNSLRVLTKSLKIRLQSSSMELLKDIKDTLSRSKEFQFLKPTPVPVDLEKKRSEAKARNESIIKTLTELKDNLKAEGKKDKEAFMNSLNKSEKESWSLLQKNNSMLPASVPVTLDKVSADADLTFSQDLKKVTLYIVGGKASSGQAKPRPFYPFHCVRGSPGLSSGRQVWEAEIQGPSGGACIVGVATESARGSQSQNFSTQSCIWALRISPSGCQPFTNCKAQEHLQICLRKVGVYVNHDCGEIVFYDAITGKHIYTFQTSFDGKVFPLFGLQVACSHITLSP